MISALFLSVAAVCIGVALKLSREEISRW